MLFLKILFIILNIHIKVYKAIKPLIMNKYLTNSAATNASPQKVTATKKHNFLTGGSVKPQGTDASPIKMEFPKTEETPAANSVKRSTWEQSETKQPASARAPYKKESVIM